MVAAPLATVEEITVVDVSSGQALVDVSSGQALVDVSSGQALVDASSGQALVHQLLDRRVQVAA